MHLSDPQLFFFFIENGSEDIDILPSGLAFISSVSISHAPQMRRSTAVWTEH